MLGARSGVGETEDLSTLSSLDENILLEELKQRYSQDKIYVSHDRISKFLNHCLTTDICE